MKFYTSTDNIDIAAKSIGIHGPSLPDRGLCIQIRHNGDKELFEEANNMAGKIVKALNQDLTQLDQAIEHVLKDDLEELSKRLDGKDVLEFKEHELEAFFGGQTVVNLVLEVIARTKMQKELVKRAGT